MQKKLYVGGLPWEIDRIGLLNYFKAILECNDIIASYEPNFTTAPISNPNSAITVVDVFVAMDRETGKSRGFGFITLEMGEEEASATLFEKIIELVNKRIMMGIRGPRELIVNEAEPKVENGNSAPREPRESREDNAPKDEEPAEGGVTLDW
jgi:RNA recognition motif-containing protein